LWPKLDGMDSENMCGTNRMVEDFERMMISRNGGINWPPKSRIYTFFFGTILSRRSNQINRKQLMLSSQHNQRHSAHSTGFMRQSHRKLGRIRATKQGHGGHLNDVIFHT